MTTALRIEFDMDDVFNNYSKTISDALFALRTISPYTAERTLLELLIAGIDISGDEFEHFFDGSWRFSGKWGDAHAIARKHLNAMCDDLAILAHSATR